jgi:7-carboxy-7-deazaguanine synthase
MLRIAEIFHSIQGEGKLIGVPSVFVRVSGCNLRCTWCDTPYASWNPEGDDFTVEQIVDRVMSFNSSHVVLTGGEPMIMPDIVELAARIDAHARHITIETAGTVFKPIACHLASLSPKLSNSTPTSRENGRFAIAHDAQRLRPAVIDQFIAQARATSTDFQLKFVVAGPRDLAEIDDLLLKLARPVCPADVLLMPEGTDVPTLQARSTWLADLCKSRGNRFCPRLHVDLYGNTRGT